MKHFGAGGPLLMGLSFTLSLSLSSFLFKKKKNRRTLAQSCCCTIQQYFLPPSVSLNALKLMQKPSHTQFSAEKSCFFQP